MKYTIGNIMGKTTKITMKFFSCLSKGVDKTFEKIATDEKLKNNIHEKSEKISNILDNNADIVSLKVENIVTKTVLKSEEVGTKLFKNLAEQMNASPETVKNVEICGAFVGKTVASAAVVGTCVVAVGTSASTVGASVFTHGMATLGLGSMYGGLLTASAIACSVFNTKKEDIVDQSSSNEDKQEKIDSNQNKEENIKN